MNKDFLLPIGLLIWSVINLLLAFKVELGAAVLLVQPALILAYILIAIYAAVSLWRSRGSRK